MITLSFVDRRRRPCDNEQNKIVLAKYTVVSSLVQLFTLSVVTEVWTLITGESSLVYASLSFPPGKFQSIAVLLLIVLLLFSYIYMHFVFCLTDPVFIA